MKGLAGHVRRTGRLAVGQLAIVVGLTLLAPAAGATATTLSGPRPAANGAPAAAPLTNLAHLDFLVEQVKVREKPGHTTYQLDRQPEVGVLWVYADLQKDGSFKRVGGGKYNAGEDTYGQGAFDADDIARAAVVYLRSWQSTGSSAARTQAYQQLRGLAYFQTLTGPKAGEVVLWMQPDGTLTRSATPRELPDPSDSDASYWLARSLWAFGEGYAAFRDSDPAFAAFLKTRMDLAITALRRDVLDEFGSNQIIHGVRVPKWLIADGADASSEAVLGLAAYVKAGGDTSARTALRQLADGISALSAGTTTQWPYRALLPWALSRSFWHAWGSNMPASLAAASIALDEKSVLSKAVDDAAGFSPQLLTSTGPVNGLLPTPVDANQIAYGADARVQGLLAVGAASGRPGIRQLAGIAAGWFFGQNASGAAVYDPATGVTRDGVNPQGVVNGNSGAESTIHGLLTMQVLDANPDLAALALASASIKTRDGLVVLEAESAVLGSGAVVHTPVSAWTGESQWSGDYVAAGPGSTITWTLPASDQPRLLQPVVELTPGSAARSTLISGRTPLGTVRYGAVGRQGNAPSPTELMAVDPGRTLRANATTARLRTSGGTGNVDALLVMPEIATLLTEGGGHATALLTSKSSSGEHRTVSLGGTGVADVASYDRAGRLVSRQSIAGPSPVVKIAPGGFTVLTR